VQPAGPASWRQWAMEIPDDKIQNALQLMNDARLEYAKFMESFFNQQNSTEIALNSNNK
jgi:hypothetical protein